MNRICQHCDAYATDDADQKCNSCGKPYHTPEHMEDRKRYSLGSMAGLTAQVLRGIQGGYTWGQAGSCATTFLSSNVATAKRY